jgi:hypothetical protein
VTAKQEDAERLINVPIDRREQELIELMRLDRALCDSKSRVADDTIAAVEAGLRIKFCSECGRMFKPMCKASKYCGPLCASAHERRRSRDRTGQPTILPKTTHRAITVQATGRGQPAGRARPAKVTASVDCSIRGETLVM